MTQTLWRLVLFLLLTGCTQENKRLLSMDELLKMPSEQLFNLRVKDLDHSKIEQ